MRDAIVNPLPGYILKTFEEHTPGFAFRSRKARKAAVAKRKRKLEMDIASGKVKIDKTSTEYDTTDSFGRVVHVEWRGGRKIPGVH